VGDISFTVDAVSVQGVAPGSLEALLDCLVRMMLNAFLEDVRLPFNSSTPVSSSSPSKRSARDRRPDHAERDVS